MSVENKRHTNAHQPFTSLSPTGVSIPPSPPDSTRTDASAWTLFLSFRTSGRRPPSVISFSNFAHLDAANVMPRIQSLRFHHGIRHPQPNHIASHRFGCPRMGPEAPRIICSLRKMLHSHVLLFRIETYFQHLNRARSSPQDSHNPVLDSAIHKPLLDRRWPVIFRQFRDASL